MANSPYQRGKTKHSLHSLTNAVLTLPVSPELPGSKGFVFVFVYSCLLQVAAIDDSPEFRLGIRLNARMDRGKYRSTNLPHKTNQSQILWLFRRLAPLRL